jgi:hypothetical protein
VSIEDAMSEAHLPFGVRKPPAETLRSECAIVAGMARTTLPDSTTAWEWYVEDYDRIRDTMAQVLPGFEDFNRRVREPLGFRITQPPASASSTPRPAAPSSTRANSPT